MVSRRRYLRRIGLLAAGGTLVGCVTGSDTEDERPPEPTSTTAGDSPGSPTRSEATPHPHYAECPGPGERPPGAGEPLEMSLVRGPPATYDGNRLEEFVREECASLYREDVADEITDRVGHELRQNVFDRGGRRATEDPHIVAYLVFDFRTESGELREVPPIGFEEYREAVPSSLSAAVIVNDERHECTIPVRTGCIDFRW